MKSSPKEVGQSGGVAISGSIDKIYGDIVGGNKIGLNEEELISLLEAHGFLIRKASAELRSMPAGKAGDRDQERMSKYLQLFERSAFEIPCIFEGSLLWLDQAVDQIQNALGTGRVRFRGPHQAAYKVPRRSEFETQPYKDALAQVARILLLLKHEVSALIELMEGDHPGSIRDGDYIHMEFWLAGRIRSGAERSFIADLIERMDQIDRLRNVILDIFKLKRIPVSSELLKASPKMRKYDWEHFYLREHEVINGFLG